MTKSNTFSWTIEADVDVCWFSEESVKENTFGLMFKCEKLKINGSSLKLILGDSISSGIV